MWLNRSVDTYTIYVSRWLSLFDSRGSSLPIPSNIYYNGGSSTSKPYYNEEYTCSYAHDVMGYSNSDIVTIFDGEPYV